MDVLEAEGSGTTGKINTPKTSENGEATIRVSASAPVNQEMTDEQEDSPGSYMFWRNIHTEQIWPDSAVGCLRAEYIQNPLTKITGYETLSDENRIIDPLSKIFSGRHISSIDSVQILQPGQDLEQISS